MTGFIKNVFISHIHEDDHGLAKLKKILSDHNLDVRDSSINSSNPNNATSPEYIKSSILAPQVPVGQHVDCLCHGRHSPQRMGELGNRIRSETGQADRRGLG